jgi:hypothetical protein
MHVDAADLIAQAEALAKRSGKTEPPRTERAAAAARRAAAMGELRETRPDLYECVVNGGVPPHVAVERALIDAALETR